MADLPQTPVIEWAEVLQLVAAPTGAKIASVAKSPDGRSLSILLEGLEVRCEGRGQKTAVAALAGSIAATIPPNTTWTATRADFRGATILTDGGRATIQLGLAQAFEGQSVVFSSSAGPDSVDFVRTLYSPAESWSASPASEMVSYSPLTFSVQLTLACAGESSSAFAAMDGIDVELWAR